MPDDLRHNVERTLGGSGTLDLEGDEDGEFDSLIQLRFPFPDSERQLGDMNRRMEKTFDELRQLCQERAPVDKPVDPGNEAQGFHSTRHEQRAVPTVAVKAGISWLITDYWASLWSTRTSAEVK